jgi:5-formyltetrahydrofolate cyclo-ligase
MEKKQDIRRRYQSLRGFLTEKEKSDKEEKIRERLFATDEFLKAETVYTYLSYGTEVDTLKIAAACFRLGKPVAVPKVFPNRRMEFYEIRDFSEVSTGFHGILEPDVKKIDKRLPCKAAGLFLVPGLVFETGGQRLGYGGGYYDTYFSQLPKENFYLLGLCFDLQVTDTLFWEPEVTDKTVDGILTETHTYRIERIDEHELTGA